MKFFYTFSLLSSFCLSCFSQSTISFPLQNATWETDFQTSSIGPPPGGYGHIYKQYRTAGTKQIDSITYTIIESGGKSEYCYLREDSNRVYCRYAAGIGYGTAEFMLFDFNLELGDTFNLPIAESPIQFDGGTVGFIDSVLIGDVSHRRLWIDGFTWNNFVFIEGVGAVEGLMYPEIWTIDQSAWMTCFSRNDTIFKTNGENTTSEGNCWRYVGIREPATPTSIVFPNPTADVIEIQIEHFQKAQLIDLNGKLISTSSQPKFSIQHLIPGSYLLLVTNQSNEASFHSIIKTY